MHALKQLLHHPDLIQTHVVEDEMSDHAKSVIPGNADVSIYDIMARCALNEEDETELMRYTQSKARPHARACPTVPDCAASLAPR